MKFLILAALVAVAAADYHDDTFHFSSLGSVSGLRKASFVQAASPVLSKKVVSYTPAITKQYTSVQSSPVYSSIVAQPAYTQQYSAVKQVAAAPLLVKSIEQEIPVYSQQYTAQIAQPVFAQQYAVKQIAQPAISQYSAINKIAQPVYSQQYAVKQIAQPVYSQYSAINKIAQPVYSQQYAVKQLAQPAISQYSVSKIAEPIAKPLIAQQYSAASLAGVSTYAANYNAPQFRILSQVQETDATGPYKLAYSTENGIQATEEGSLIDSAEGPVVAAQGSYSYTGPDGVLYTVNYIADENGFRASGDHLPTPPPIPAEILRSLEENAASNEQYDDQGRLLQK